MEGVLKRESSGRLWLTADVARFYGVTPAAVRQWVSSGRLKPAHVTPGNVAVFYAQDVMDRKAREDGFKAAVPKLRAAYGLAPLDQLELEVPCMVTPGPESVVE